MSVQVIIDWSPAESEPAKVTIFAIIPCRCPYPSLSLSEEYARLNRFAKLDVLHDAIEALEDIYQEILRDKK